MARPTGPPRCGPTRGEIKVASGKKPRLRAVDGVPGVRGVARLAEAMAVIPLVKRGLPEVKLPFQDVSVLTVAAGASLTGALARKRAPRLRRRVDRRDRLGRAGAVRAARRRARRVPRRRAQGDRRLRAGQGGRRRRVQGARPLRLAPRRAAARLQPRRHRCCCGARSTSRARWRAARSRSPRPRWPSRCSRGASATPRRSSRRRSGGPGFEIQRLIGTREPDERQLEVGRAALAEILRVEAVELRSTPHCEAA